MSVVLNLGKSNFVPKFYPYLRDWTTRWFVMMGGAGSGKSVFAVQKILIRCFEEKIRFVVCRRYGTTLRNSCFALFKEVLSAWKLTPYVKIKETDMSITFPNGSTIVMIGLDEETKLLSLTNISGIWCEEAYEIPESILTQLNLRMRGEAKNQQIILSFNPISKQSYLYNMCEVNPPDSFTYLVTTYKDNPFLNQEYIDALEEMKERNPAKYRVYGLAQYGVDTDSLVFSNWEVKEFDAMLLAKEGLEHRAGCDLGWTDPTAITDTLYDEKNHTIYVFNEFYKSGCQLTEIADKIKEMKLNKVKLYVDSAEPRSVDFFRNADINAVPCIKGKDSVKSGIMFLQDNHLVIHPSCVNLIKELENFQYIKSKKTGQLTEDTTHEWSHAIDSLRYGYSDIYARHKLKTISKSSLNL